MTALVRTSGVLVTKIFLSLAVIKSRLSTPLPKLEINFNRLALFIIDASMVSEIHGIRISMFSTFFLSSL